MRREIPEECKEIMKFISVCGGITERQLNKLLKEKKKNQEFYIHALESGNYIKEEPHGIYTATLQKSKYTDAMQFCAWVLLSNYTNEDGTNVDILPGTSPIHLSFLRNGTLFNLAYVDKNCGGILATLEKKYNDQYKPVRIKGIDIQTEPFKYIVVISDESVIPYIQSANMNAPYVIAHVKSTIDGIPVIDYYK